MLEVESKDKKFIMMNNEIIQLRAELLKRSKDYLSDKENTSRSAYSVSEGVENAIDHVKLFKTNRRNRNRKLRKNS